MRAIPTILVGAIALTVSAAGLASKTAAAERVLRLTLQLPITNVLGQNVSAFKEIVERESGGGIKIELYPSAKLYKDNEVPEAVASGAIEMGVASVTRFASPIPAANLFGLPFLFRTYEDVALATSPGHPIRDGLDRELRSIGVRPLWWQPFGLTVMLGRTKAPLRPADLQGRKVRVFGETMGAFVNAMGGEPVPLSGSQQRDAYKEGAVDFGMTGVTSVESRKLHEVMGYLVNTKHTAAEFVVVINDALWRSLPRTDRAILSEAAVRVEKDLRQSYRRTHQRTLEWISANTSMKVHELNAEQRAAWREASKPVYDWYVRRAGGIGESLLAEAQKLH